MSTPLPTQRAAPSVPGESAAVLVVEDDDTIGIPLVEGLELEGFAPIRVRSGADAVVAADSAEFVLLDLGLPDLDGGEVCRRIRARTDVPIIVVTAREDELDRVRLLEIGADDYVVKPFGFRELVARIRAVQRRTGRPDRSPTTVQQFGPLRIDRGARRVHLHGVEIELTPKDPTGTGHGRFAHLRRTLQSLVHEGELQRTQRELDAGHAFVAVDTDDAHADDIADLLRRHHAHNLVHYGRYTWERLGPAA